MKKFFILLLFSIGVTFSTRGQAIDTLRIYNFGKMPIAYSEENIYWGRNYDSNGRLLFEGLRYTDCFIGAFISYYNNGEKRTQGQYLSNTTGNWKDLGLRGLCSVQTGEWKEYNESGILTKKYLYENGKLVKEQSTIDTAITANFGKMPPVYFSNKVYWEKNYDKDNHLLYEALKYNSCFIGEYFGYYNDRKLKSSGQYLANTTGDWANLKKRGLCSVMDGEWKNFDASGNLKKTVVYKQGEVIKEY